MNDDEITWQIITYSKISNACALFCFNIVYYMNIYKIPDAYCAWQDWSYNLWVKHIFPVLRKISWKCSGKYFSGKLTSRLSQCTRNRCMVTSTRLSDQRRRPSVSANSIPSCTMARKIHYTCLLDCDSVDISWPDLQPRGHGFDPRQRSICLGLTKLAILSGLVNWYQFRLGLKDLRLMGLT